MDHLFQSAVWITCDNTVLHYAHIH